MFRQIATRFADSPDPIIAIRPEALVVQTWARRPEAFIQDEAKIRPASNSGRGRKVGIIPTTGPIDQKPSMFGGTSIQELSRDLRAMASEADAIVLDVDSPGGFISGVEDMANEIAAVSRETPIVAISNSMMASAALWLSSGATEIFATNGSETGSIGVVAMHANMAGAMASAGIEVSIITSADFKAEANPFEALSDDGRDHIQARVDEIHKTFVKAVSVGRGVSPSEVNAKFGKGRVLSADQALAVGMVDRIGTLSDAVARAATLSRPAAGRGTKRRGRAVKLEARKLSMMDG